MRPYGLVRSERESLMSKKQETAEQEAAEKEQAADRESMATEESGGAGGEAQTPEQEIEALREEAKAQHENYLRAMAEVDNVRRRSEREVANAHKFGLEKFVAELLPVRDSLEMGLSASDQNGADAAALREGTELTLRMLGQVMEKFGVEEVNPEGDPFNPERHEAVATRETGSVEADTVVEVMQKGYLLNERVVRPAMVVVARAPSGDANSDPDNRG